MSMVKVGDTVLWRGCFGTEAPRRVKVTGLETTRLPRTKYGRHVTRAPWRMVNENRVVFWLDNGHWAYGSQISPAE